MAKDPDRFKSLDTMLPQGARSRHAKAVQAMDAADDLIPEDGLAGSAAEIRQAIKHLQAAAEHLAEMMAYRKIMGVD